MNDRHHGSDTTGFGQESRPSAKADGDAAATDWLPSSAQQDQQDDPLAQRGDLIALLGTTARVFDDCLLPNGALVEAPAHLPFYPATAPNALHCRPGIDITFALLAMDALHRDVRAPLLRWLRDRAAGFKDDGLLRASYFVHGPVADDRDDLVGTGALLLALHRRPVPSSVLIEDVSRMLASALAVRWDGHRFRHHDDTDAPTRAAELVLVEAALRAASVALQVDAWARVADALVAPRAAALAHHLETGCALVAEERDRSVQAHLFLAWPLSSPSDEDPRLVDRAEEAVGSHVLGADTGYTDTHVPIRHADAGPHPVELFWLALAQLAVGRRERAERYFALGMALADASAHIPGRADLPGVAPSPKPHLQSHLLFVLAAEALGHLATLPRSGYTGRRRPGDVNPRSLLPDRHE